MVGKGQTTGVGGENKIGGDVRNITLPALGGIHGKTTNQMGKEGCQKYKGRDGTGYNIGLRILHILGLGDG